MDITDIISRLEIVLDNIEFEEITINEVQEALTLLVNDLESSSNFDADFGDIGFEDLDWYLLTSFKKIRLLLN